MPFDKKPKKPPQKIAHIGIAVSHLEQALPFYTHALGLPLEKIENVATEGVRVAFLKIGDTRIELLEPLHETSPIHSFIEKKGEGIHHIAFEVDHLEKRLTALKEKGIPLINETPKQGADQTAIAFLHPKAAHGVLVELCEHKEGDSSDGHV